MCAFVGYRGLLVLSIALACCWTATGLPHSSSSSSSYGESEVSSLPCESNGRLVLHGDHFQISDCAACVCDNSTLTCQFRSCPQLICYKRIKVEGECCKICDYTTPQVHDEDVDGDDGRNERPLCTDSSLHSLDVLRSVLETEVVHLLVEQELLDKQESDQLAETRNHFNNIAGEVSSLPCLSEGGLVLHGDHFQISDCAACVCDNSHLTCQLRSCPQLICYKRIKVEGECCKICDYTTPQVHDEDVGGDDGRNERPLSTDSSLHSLDVLLPVLETEEGSSLVEQEPLDKQESAGMISNMETRP